MNSDMNPTMHFLNVRQTANELGVHENTVRNWVKEGKLTSSQIPGSRGHRFTRQEVLRLKEQRGNPVSAIAPTFQHNTELVTAQLLDAWASTSQAPSVFPELMRRLLAATPGIFNLDMRAHEGVAAPGWDGSARSTGSTYLPPGELLFELSTNAASKSKADEDYKKRSSSGEKIEDKFFVFATPRNWAGARQWATGRSSESRFAGVKAIDAHVLEGWLQAAPYVQTWFSERIGLKPRGVQSLDAWYTNFQAQTRPALPSSFFRAGRDKEAQQLVASIQNRLQEHEAITVCVPWFDEFLAFTFATLQEYPELMEKTFVVSDGDAWTRLVESDTRLILIPHPESSFEVHSALNKGHCVILHGSSKTVHSEREVRLPKIHREVGYRVLASTGDFGNQSHALVALGRRSMPALIRKIAVAKQSQTPNWLKNPATVAVLAPLFLAGSWTKYKNDPDVIQEFTGIQLDKVEHLLKTLAFEPNAPFALSGGAWRLSSPTDDALLLVPMLTASNLSCWQSISTKVLLTPNPTWTIKLVERSSETHGNAPIEYSTTLKEGLASNLALVASLIEQTQTSFEIQDSIDSIVKQLLDVACSDASGETWNTLSSNLPHLAEASPDCFLDALDQDLKSESPTLKTMFTDHGEQPSLGSSSPHPSLLWALESLCWSPNQFRRAADVLIDLCILDPGGSLRNRPLESLQKITLGSTTQSHATAEQKIDVVRRLFAKSSTVGWELLLKLWPNSHDIIFAAHEPTYRDWLPTDKKESLDEWDQYIEELVTLVLDESGAQVARWVDIIKRVDNIAGRWRTLVFTKLEESIFDNSWSQDENYVLWNALTSEATKHEDYADAKWALPRDEVTILQSLANSITLVGDPRIHADLFSWDREMIELDDAESDHKEKLLHHQEQVVSQVLAQGIESVRELVMVSDTPYRIGTILAGNEDAPTDDILSWLTSSDSKLQNTSMNFAQQRCRRGGFKWLKAALDSPSCQDPSVAAALVGVAPFDPQIFSKLTSLGADLEKAYWRGINPYQLDKDQRPLAAQLLLHRGEPWNAAIALGVALDDGPSVDAGLVKNVLNAICSTDASPPLRVNTRFQLAKLLGFLEERVPDDEDLPKLEFAFFPILHNHQPSAALYRSLNSNPDEFVHLVGAVYRSEGQKRPKLTPTQQQFGQIAWEVLRAWPVIPGQGANAEIDSEQLNNWIKKARFELSERKLSSVGDEQIGEILSASPTGDDGVWPAEPVRDVIENLGSERLETGVHIGRINRRGTTTRGVYEGGSQEWQLAEEYKHMAESIASSSPRTARMLRGLVSSYQRDAAREDNEAESRADDG